MTLDLIARIGGFEKGMDQAARKSERTAAQIARDQKKRAQEMEQAWANAGTAIGVGLTAATAALAVWIKGSVDAIDQFNDLKDITGSSIENISALDSIARQTGSTFDQVSSTLTKFNGVLKDADPTKGPGAVLKALNLDIEELKKLDPAEALRQTAVALQRFADDGGKARAVQELFGKSVKETAPFLKDLAEAGELQAKVTTQAAEEIDRFNKEMARAMATVDDLGRSLTIDLVSSINDVSDAFTKGRAAGKGFFEIASDRYWKNIKDFYRDIGLLEKEAPKFQPTFGVDDQSAAEMARLLRQSAMPSLEVPGDPKKPPKGPRKDNEAERAAKEAQSYLEKLQLQLRATEELTAVETVLRDIQDGRLKLAGGVTEQELVGIARQIDASKALSKSLDEQKKAREANEQTQMRIDQQAFASVEAMISSNQALREEIELIGVEGQARTAIEQARISSTIALKEEELVMLKNAEASAAQISALEREIVLLAQRRELLGQQGVRVQEVEEIKQAKEYSKELNSDLKRAFSDAFRDTKNPLKAFGESLYSTVLSRVSAALAESLATNALKSLGNGSNSGGGDWIGTIAKLFSGGGGGFGSGAAYGNQDLGLNFEGGGYTGSGARAGGLDGKGGFMAMVHPNETVIDHTQGGLVSQSNVTVNVINQGGGNLAVTGQRQTRGADGSMNIDVMVEALQGVMADNLSNGSGSLARAMEGRYGLRTAVS